MRSLIRVVLFGVSYVCAAACFGQANTPPTVSVKVDKPIIAAAKPFKAVVSVTFADGLHGYQNPASSQNFIPVAVTAGDKTFTVVSVSYPKGTPTTVAGEDKPVSIYAGTVKIVVTLKAPAKLGKTTLKLAFYYQQCNESSCFPPSTVSVAAPVTVAKTVKATKATG